MSEEDAVQQRMGGNDGHNSSKRETFRQKHLEALLCDAQFKGGCSLETTNIVHMGVKGDAVASLQL